MEVKPEKKLILEALSRSVGEKRERLLQLGMMNVYGLDESPAPGWRERKRGRVRGAGGELRTTRSRPA
jgi:hypothetical protein